MTTNNQFIREYDGDGRTVMFKNIRGSFLDSIKDKKPTVENGEPKHTGNFIFEADKPGFEEKKAAAIKAIKAACEKTWKAPDRYKSIMEDNPKRLALRKGERFKNSEGTVYAGYEGNMVIAAAGPGGGKKRPKLLDRRGNEVPYDKIDEIVYSGCYLDVKISFFATDKGGQGVFATIEAIKSREIGERTGGGSQPTSADEFDEFDDDADGSFDGDDF